MKSPYGLVDIVGTSLVHRPALIYTTLGGFAHIRDSGISDSHRSSWMGSEPWAIASVRFWN